jgi:TolB-like protein/two-component SAPR family response regulator/Flp pilus assembly protein TadD
MPGSSSADLRIRVLGAFNVELCGVAIPESDWPRQKTKALFKVLLTTPGRIFSVDQLIDTLLPNASVERAGSNIKARVSELRRVLEPGLSRGQDSQYIVNAGEGYTFNTGASYWLDAEAFTKQILVAELAFEQGHWAKAAESFEEAFVLYRGEFLPEDRLAEWSQASRDQLQGIYLEASGRLAACYVELGRHRQAIHCCHRVLAIAPHRESVVLQLMGCYAETGERSKALEAYDTGVRELRERLDVDPSLELRDLRDRIAIQTSLPEVSAYDSRRIAVVPFVSIGSDSSDEFLADGMTEELIYTLSKVAGLEVIAQTTVLKYKGARKRVTEIGQELQVGSLLEGSVQRVQNRARILVQLINVENEAHIWAEQYDRDMQDILGVQGDIARQVADALKVQLLAREDTSLRKDEAVSRDAHNAYMKGRLFLAKDTRDACQKAIDYFEQALAIMPDYARALAGLADAHLSMVGLISAEEAYGKAKPYTQQALALDPLCSEAHATLGRIAWRGNGDVHGAEDAFLRSIELNPNYALAHELYAALLIHTGRAREACQRSEIALSLDPLSATLVETYAKSLHASGRLVEAVDQYQKALEIDPAMEIAWWGLWYSLAMQWDWDQAEAVTRRGVERYPDNPYAHVNLSQCIVCLGRMEEALIEIRKALAVAGDPPTLSVLVQAGYSHYFTRHYDEAVGYLHQALRVNPSANYAHNAMAKCYIQQGCYDEALKELDAAERMFDGADAFWSSQVHMDRGIICAARGETEKAETELAALMGSSGKRNRRFAISVLLYALGRTEDSMDWLEAAATAHEPFVIILGVLPECDPMKLHPRFQALLKRIGLAG